MQNILLSFLGTGSYESCRYTLDDHTSDPSPFCAIALAECLDCEKIISLETSLASETHGDKLFKAAKEKNLAYQAVRIPDGKTEAELWDIFTKLTSSLPESCTLYLDITHGFRSLPMIGFLALNYLRVTRDDLNIGGIYYGAFDPSDYSKGERTFPIFNLTPFLDLLQWTSGAEQFKNTGSATLLGEQLRKTHANLWQEQKLPKQELPKQLQNLGKALEDSSNTIHLLRTQHLEEKAKNLQACIEQAIDETNTHAKPFAELLKPISTELTRFNSTDLSTLRDLISWLIEKGKIDTALTLASEWTTSYVMLTLGKPDHHTDYKNRRPYTRALSAISQNIEEEKIKDQEKILIKKLKDTLSSEDFQCLKKLDASITNARNDLNHAGFNTQNASYNKLLKTAEKISEQLNNLPLKNSPQE